jgi:hypothetical protein
MAAETPISSRAMEDLDLVDGAFFITALGHSPLRPRA